MRAQSKTLPGAAVPEYREVSVKPAIATLIVAIVLICVPLGWLINKIGTEGLQQSDITRFKDLAALVDKNVSSIRAVLDNDAIDEAVLTGSALPVVTVITPGISPTNIEEAASSHGNDFNVRLSAIYWNPHDPLVTIDDENYRVGDLVNGYKIKEIRKTEVVFLSPFGDPVVKYFYDYLD